VESCAAAGAGAAADVSGFTDESGFTEELELDAEAGAAGCAALLSDSTAFGL